MGWAERVAARTAGLGSSLSEASCVRYQDVIAYKERIDAERSKALDALAMQAGIRAMRTHPIDEEAARFYTRFGFLLSPLREQQLLLLLKDAKKVVR